MDIFPATAAAPPQIELAGVQVSLLGSLQSSRGIHILATDSLQSGEIESELTPDMPMLTCGLRVPQDAMFRRRGGPFQTCGALNYISPNSAVTSRAAASTRCRYACSRRRF